MKYDAFISYRHTDRDMFVAKLLHKSLETFKVPKSVQKTSGKKSIKRVFRDQEELPIGADLDDNITRALSDSEFLIAVCSPRYCESDWCRKEISTFAQTHPRDHILALLIEGEPRDSFPAELLKDENGKPVEPLAADLRAETEAEVRKKMKNEVLRLAAPLLGCTYDDIKQRHKERRMRKIITTLIAAALFIAAISVGFGIYNANMVRKISEQKQIVEETKALIQEQYAETKINLEGKQENQSKFLAKTSSDLLAVGDRRSAVLVALEALPVKGREGRPLVPDAVRSLSDALYVYRVSEEIDFDRILEHDHVVSSVTVSSDGKYVTSIDQAENVHVWESVNGKEILTLPCVYSEYGYLETVQYAGVYKDVVAVGRDTSVSLYDLEGNSLKEIECHYSNIHGNCFQGKIAVQSLDTMEVYDWLTGKLENSFICPGKNFTDKPVFSPNGKFLIASVNPESEDAGHIARYNLETGEEKNIETAEASISAMTVSDNGEVFSASTPTFAYYDSDDYFLTVEGFDESGRVLKQDIHLDAIDAFGTLPKIRCRKYQNEYGQTVSDVVVSAANSVYCYDVLSGELKSKTSFEGYVSDVLVSADSKMLFAGIRSGMIYFVNGDTGVNYTDYAIDTGSVLNEFTVNKDMVIVTPRSSLDVIMMKYVQGKEIEEIVATEGIVGEIVVSEDGKYLAFAEDPTYDQYILRVCDAETGEEILSEDVESSPTYIGFYKDSVIYVDYYGISVYSLLNGEKKKFVNGNFGITDVRVSSDKTKLAAYSSGEFLVVDLVSQKEMYRGQFSEFGRHVAAVPNDGEKLYAFGTDGLYCYKPGKDGVRISEEIEGYAAGINGNIFAISPCSDRLAIKLGNGSIDIVNIETGEVEWEISQAGGYNSYISFSNDGKKLFFQNDNDVLRIYSIDDKKELFIGSERMSCAEKIEEYPDKNLIGIKTFSEEYLLDATTFGTLAYVPFAWDFCAATDMFFVRGSSTICTCPYFSLDELVKIAEEEFPGEELSSEERVRYYID